MDAVLFSGLGPCWLTFLAGSAQLMTERDWDANPKVFHLFEKGIVPLSGPQSKKSSTRQV